MGDQVANIMQFFLNYFRNYDAGLANGSLDIELQ